MLACTGETEDMMLAKPAGCWAREPAILPAELHGTLQWRLLALAPRSSILAAVGDGSIESLLLS